ncbi:AMIN-like domain-containing (lipo)protein [Actinokineospora sp.]|uniref:AMIN-like domain-containing (lipo)protein n=1 Tax=Actinokineospora sp. TaxID=1872133 RepID=UPI003D6A9BE7
MKARRWTKRLTTLAVTLGAAAAVAVVGPSSASATEGYCGISWGSLAKSATPTESAPMVGVRGGRHYCWDRLVIDIRSGGADGYRVQYVSEVIQDGSGHVVPLRGGAKLQILATAPAYDDYGNPTFTPANRNELVNVTGWQTFRQVAYAGSFEGQTTIGLGVRARLPFRTFVLNNPDGGSRIVIDVAHFW